MADVHTRQQRSYNMSKIRRSKTKPETRLRETLSILGFSYQPKGIYGSPDFARKRSRIAIFVDGCFWHGCSKHFIQPRTNTAFWKSKINHNIERDKDVTKKLISDDWRVIRIWEHNIKKLK
jgi:DNA mismatch endonuclease (patch repair protein)